MFNINISNLIMKNIFSGIHTVSLIALTFIFSGTVSAETIIVPTGTDDTELIQSTLDGLQKGDTLLLDGDFMFAKTLYLPSDFTWILSGTLTLSGDAVLDEVGFVAPGIDARRRTAITEKEGGATNIDMSGGSYFGNYTNYTKSLRFINFVSVTYSKFHNMIMTEVIDDIFTLGPGCNNNECRNLHSTYSLRGNGLTDKGDHNYWYDCIVEYCLGPDGDGFTPKCRNSEFHRCISRYNGGPGFGMFCRIDGSGNPVDLGERIDGNKFYACVAHNNEGAGFSFNISSTSGEGGTIRNNYVEALCFNNKESGVRFRNKMPNSYVENNEINLVCFGNLGQKGTSTELSPTAGGLGSDGGVDNPVSGITGKIVSYDNIGCDVNLGTATNCNITIYKPTGESEPVIKPGNGSNTISTTSFNCSDVLDYWCKKKYCEMSHPDIALHKK